eukprot:GFKZ01011959.1.p1 GENE.GFKZ01011959.1~~GFKZ01011959.1.p1  ORF type:complete len:1063 (-),score=144.52 GFKZ01011959.1:1784-4846(-)
MHSPSAPPAGPSAPPDPGDSDEPEAPSTPQTPVSEPSSASQRQDDPSTPVKISVPVPRDAVGFIIGKRGETVRNMMHKSNAYIAVDREDTNPHAPSRLFHIEGDRAAVSAAHALIREKVAAVLYGRPHPRIHDPALTPLRDHHSAGQIDIPIDDAPLSEPLEMWIPRGCVGMIIGHGGQVINEMQERAGATIVVHNNKMDRNGSKLLTISGGEREKHHAKELIQNVLDRVGLRNRFSDHPPHGQDAPQWGFVPPHQHPHGNPWYFSHPNHPVQFDPRQLSEFPPRYPPLMQPWLPPIHLHPQPQRQPSQMVPSPQVPPQTPQPPRQQPQGAPRTPPQQPHPQLPLQIPQQPHDKQRPQQLHPQLPPLAQLPQQIQQSRQGAQQPQQVSQQPGPSQHQPPHQMPSQLQPNPMVPGPHLTGQLNPIYQPQMPPTGQPMPWTPGQVPYPMTPPVPPAFDSNIVAGPHIGKIATKAVFVPSSCVGIIIGRSGETIRDLQQRSGAHIKVTPDRDAKDDAPHRVIYISGTPAALELAQSLVNDVINEGLTRSYRDGLEPRSGSQQQSQGSSERQYQRGDDKTSDSGATKQEDGGNEQKNNDSEDQDVGRTERDDHAEKKVRGTGGENRSSSSFSEISSVREEEKYVGMTQSENLGETGKPSKEGKVGDPDVAQTWTGDEEEADEQYETLQEYDQENDDGDEDNVSVPFTGEGRLVERPVTSYPSNSISFQMKIPHAKVGVIIGKRGSTIRLLQQRSGARIVVSKKIDTSKEDNPRAVTITGPEPFVENARRLIVAKINPPAGEVLKAEEKDIGGDSLDYDDGALGDEAAVDSLAVDFGNQSLNSPSATTVVPETPVPISNIGAPQNPQFGPYQRPLPFMGPMPGVPFSNVTQMQRVRPVARSDMLDFQQLDAQAHQHPQFPPQFMGPQQYAERMPVGLGFPFSHNVESGDALQPGYGDFRPEHFFPHPGSSFAGIPMDGSGNFMGEHMPQVGYPSGGQDFTIGEDVMYGYQGEDHDLHGRASASAV